MSFSRVLAAAREESRAFAVSILQLSWMRTRRDYYVYIMSSPSRTLNTGVTNNLERRVAEHKEHRPGSFTARYNIEMLVYFEEFGSINGAIVRESEIKQMARRTKIALIESTNPEWRDLTTE